MDSVVDFQAGLVKGATDLIQGVTGAAAHPLQTTQGAFDLFDQAAQTTLTSQAIQFLGEAAMGRYDSLDQAADAWMDRSDPLRLAQGKWNLTKDVGSAVFAESIEAWKEGKYSEAIGRLLGQNVDVVLGAGIIGKSGKAARLGRGVDALDTANDIEKTLGATRRIDRMEWPPTPPIGPKPGFTEPGAAQWRYRRYVYRNHIAGTGPDDILPPELWKQRYFDPAAHGGRPGRLGGPEQLAAKQTLREEGIRLVENVELGGRFPDGIRPMPNELGGTDYYEVGRMLRSGLPEARERVKLVDELRALGKNDTVTFVDRVDPSRRVTYRVGDLVDLFETIGRRG